jgi:hypothetical protein
MHRSSPDEVEPLLNEQPDNRRPIVSPSPFARYLAQENQQRLMRENIEGFQSDRSIGKVSRFFNNFQDEYDGINKFGRVYLLMQTASQQNAQKKGKTMICGNSASLAKPLKKPRFAFG